MTDHEDCRYFIWEGKKVARYQSKIQDNQLDVQSQAIVACHGIYMAGDSQNRGYNLLAGKEKIKDQSLDQKGELLCRNM